MLQKCHLEEDPWTGETYYDYKGGCYRFPALGDFKNTNANNLYFVTDDFEKAIDKIVEWLKPLFVKEEAAA